jgi:hypothetical protein
MLSCRPKTNRGRHHLSLWLGSVTVVICISLYRGHDEKIGDEGTEDVAAASSRIIHIEWN